MTEQTSEEAARISALEDQLEKLGSEKPLSFWRIAVIRLRRDRLTMAAITVLLIIAVASILAGPISTYLLEVNPEATDLLMAFEPPSADRLLGSDALGRDQLSRLLFGGRISLKIAFFGGIFTIGLGILVGMLAAYFGKFVDDLIIWIINSVSSIPGLFLLLIVGSVFTLNDNSLMLIFALLGWPGVARLVRSTVFSLREQEYVIAARALGASDSSIMWRHILPNVIPITIIVTARRIGSLILAETGLSFLGFGVQPPTPTWGNMLTKALQFIIRPDGQHLLLAPGILITVTVLCLYIIGDGLRDAMDPRLK